MSSEMPLVIIGAGGHGREALDVLESAHPSSRHRFLGFLDDVEPDREILARRNAVWLGVVSRVTELDAEYLIGIGSGDVRCHIDGKLLRAGRSSATLVHPAATIASDVEIGPGSIITAGASLTTNIRAGRHFHVNLNATIAHDCLIGDYVTVSPGATISGNVVLEHRVSIGTGANVIPGVRVGEGAIVGAGAVVVRDVEPGDTVVGVPARSICRSALGAR